MCDEPYRNNWQLKNKHIKDKAWVLFCTYLNCCLNDNDASKLDMKSHYFTAPETDGIDNFG